MCSAVISLLEMPMAGALDWAVFQERRISYYKKKSDYFPYTHNLAINSLNPKP